MINEGQVAFQAYQSGELDMIGAGAEDLQAIEADPVLSQELSDSPPHCTFYIGFNQTRAPFDNKQVRQAFAQAFDREAWSRDVFSGLAKPTQTFIPPGFPGYEASDQFPFDPAAAKAKLAEAGFPEGQGLPEIKLTFSSSARNKVRFEFLANQIKQNLGIDVVLDPVDPTAYTALTKSLETAPQMFYLGWCADYFDPQNWLSTVFKTGGISAGRIGYSNAQFDELVSKADVTANGPERDKLYSDAQKLLIEDAPVVFMNTDSPKILMKPYLKGFDVSSPLDPAFNGFYNLENLEVGSAQ
jgi:oligopeptide transport system substrate-binding protein